MSDLSLLYMSSDLKLCTQSSWFLYTCSEYRQAMAVCRIFLLECHCGEEDVSVNRMFYGLGLHI